MINLPAEFEFGYEGNEDLANVVEPPSIDEDGDEYDPRSPIDEQRFIKATVSNEEISDQVEVEENILPQNIIPSSYSLLHAVLPMRKLFSKNTTILGFETSNLRP